MNGRILLVASAVSILITLPATAADMPVKAPPRAVPAVAPAYVWTGCFVGAHVGGAWGRKSWNWVEDDTTPIVPPIPAGESDLSGVVGGGQLGCNYQTGSIVFGVEGDFAWTNANGSHLSTVPGATDHRFENDVDWIATATGRVGVAFDRVLLYVKGGGAWVRDEFAEVVPAQLTYRARQTRTGWTAGGGIEYAFAGNWSARIEYNYLDFGDKYVLLTAETGRTVAYDIDQHLHIVKVGINYRFGASPVVARY